MTLPLRAAWCAPLLALVLLWPWPTVAQQQPLRFLGELDIPAKSVEFEGTIVGGLSGLAYDARRDVYYAVCDDRSEFGPARFYTLRFIIGLDGIRDMQILSMTVLDSDADTPGIQPYDLNESDMEEIVLLPDDTLVISSERDRGNRPWLRHFALDGTLLSDLALPDEFVPVSMPDAQGRMVQSRGIRTNLGFEGATWVPDESALYVMNEEALAQDGPVATRTQGTNVRILRYSWGAGNAVPGRESVYHTLPIFSDTDPPGQASDNGVSALMFVRHLLPQYDFLAMERAFATGVGNDVTIFGVRLSGAQDVSSLSMLPQPFTGSTVEKTQLVNLASIGIAADNLEGLALGPRLPDGRTALLIIGDDNFNDVNQRNQFLLFEIDVPSGK
jgi:hypothetical protein